MGTHLGNIDLLLLDLAADDIDGVLGHDDVIVLGLEHLGHRARILLGGLDEDLLTGLLVLAQEGRTGTGLLIVVQEDGLILLQGDLGRMEENLLVRNIGVHGGGRSGCGGGSAHLLESGPGCFGRIWTHRRLDAIEG